MPVTNDEIAQQYLSVLGRAPTDAELKQFRQFSDSGDTPLTAADIGEIIGGLPEAQEKSLNRYGSDLENRLAGSDQRTLDLAGKSLTQQFTQMGRGGAGNDSSAYVNAFASAARDLALSRQSQLASYYGQGYQGLMNQRSALSTGLRQQGVNSINSANDWNRQLDMWNRNHDYAEDQKNRASRQNRAGVAIGLGTTALGAALGGGLAGASGSGFNLAGARFGSQVGGLGQGFGSFF